MYYSPNMYLHGSIVPAPLEFADDGLSTRGASPREPWPREIFIVIFVAALVKIPGSNGALNEERQKFLTVWGEFLIATAGEVLDGNGHGPDPIHPAMRPTNTPEFRPSKIERVRIREDKFPCSGVDGFRLPGEPHVWDCKKRGDVGIVHEKTVSKPIHFKGKDFAVFWVRMDTVVVDCRLNLIRER